MGFCTTMKTAEITRTKLSTSGVKPPSTMKVFADIYRKEGLAGINKGVNAVAIRQMTNWGSRMALSRLAEQMLRKATGKQQHDKLTAVDKIACSALGGGLSCWNQPIEVCPLSIHDVFPFTSLLLFYPICPYVLENTPVVTDARYVPEFLSYSRFLSSAMFAQ